MQPISKLYFHKEFVSNFPGDESGNLTPRQTPGVLWSAAAPTPVKAARLIGWSEQLASDLGIDKPVTQRDVDVLAGNLVTESMHPYAACYAGHQFGNWAGQLGDGRAITLGEIKTAGGAKWELQLKGAGLTPYSRHADGRAVLRSSVREYLVSEAMYHLGVPTTRALSLAETGEQVLRDMFYDGHPAYEPGAIVMRAAPTFLRFGNYEILAARKETELLRKLVDWTIGQCYSHIKGEDKVIYLFREITERTAALMVEWARVGFTHGVMNTDNMSILGLTIDYGPFGFLDAYELNYTPNTTDLPGRRYAFGRQAAIAQWNLSCLAGALVPLVGGQEPFVEILEDYPNMYWTRYYTMMGGKLGIDTVSEEDNNLVHGLEKVLINCKADMTIFFKLLEKAVANEPSAAEPSFRNFEPAFYEELQPEALAALEAWLTEYKKRRERNGFTIEQSVKMMQQHNPAFILRNYMLHECIEQLQGGDDKMFRELQELMKNPYQPSNDSYFTRRPNWASNKAGCSMLSCSS